MTDDLWAKMPCNWQTDDIRHQKIAAAKSGDAIAALKLYVALCMKANFSKKTSLPDTGCVQRSLEQLRHLVGLSKPMVVHGLRALEALDLIEKLGSRPAIYRIKEYESAPYWTKLPRLHLYGSPKETKIEKLINIPNRGKNIVHALQLYLYLACVRNRDTRKAVVSYSRITEVLGISRNNVSKAISTLVAYDLVTVRKASDDGGNVYAINAYWLRGHDPIQPRGKANDFPDPIREHAVVDISDAVYSQ